jgi:hypothetical protein
MIQVISTYEQQAIDFLQSTNTEFKCEFVENVKHFDDDKDVRDIYQITLKRGSRKYSFKFGQSIMNSQYYQDRIKERTYTLLGGCRTGKYSINDIEKYKGGLGYGQGLKLVKGQPPTAYDVLACLQKYPVYDFADFCSEFGYDEDSRKAYKTYKAVKREWENIAMLYTEAELEQLREIQ